MILLIRFILITIIIYLLVKSFVRFFNYQEPEEDLRKPNSRTDNKVRGVSKEIGEYVDYEEVDGKKKSK
jgi:large-conductance mechanosensitive channel